MKFGTILLATSAIVNNFFVGTADAAASLPTNGLISDAEPADAADSENRRKLQITAYYYGYNEAKKTWKSRNYKCTSDDVKSFKGRMSNSEICEDQYYLNNKFIKACNDGIDDYVDDKEKECFASVDECEGFGETIAQGIIATHCVLSSFSKSKGRKWPQECKDIGIKQCKKDVTNPKKYPCKPLPSDNQYKRLAELCEDEVNAYLSGPAPSPTPDKPPGSPKYKMYSNTACGSNVQYRYEDKSLGWCKDRCLSSNKTDGCFGYDYDEDKDGGRCRILLDYRSISRKSKKGVDCWIVDNPWNVCAALSSGKDCRGCCKDVEKSATDVCKCQRYAGCPRSACKK